MHGIDEDGVLQPWIFTPLLAALPVSIFPKECSKLVTLKLRTLFDSYLSNPEAFAQGVIRDLFEEETVQGYDLFSLIFGVDIDLSCADQFTMYAVKVAEDLWSF